MDVSGNCVFQSKSKTINWNFWWKTLWPQQRVGPRRKSNNSPKKVSSAAVSRPLVVAVAIH